MPLHYRWKLAGIILLMIAVVLSIFYFWFDFRLTMPVLAISSYFAEHKLFTIFPTNVADEIIVLLYLVGLGLVVFSEEKHPSPETQLLQARTMIKAVLFNTFFLILSALFIYGGSFVSILVINLFSTLVIYLLLFSISKKKLKV